MQNRLLSFTTRAVSPLAAGLILAALVVPGAPGFSQVEMSQIRDTVQVGRLTLTGYPYVFYTPEIEFALGGAMIFTMPLSKNPEVKPSNAIISGYYSAKHSYDLFFNPEFYLGDDRYYVGLTVDFWRYVDKFWGIGNSTPDTGNVDYIRKIFWVNAEFDIRVLGPLKVGVNYDLNSTAIEDKSNNDLLLSGTIQGSEGGLSSGIGMVLFADTRNSPFYPTRGGSYKLSFLNAAPWTGSSFTFRRWMLDLRHYLQIADPLVLAMQGYWSQVSGDPPFYLLPALGGDNTMRGYFEGRYRDSYYAAVQGELRARLSPRWGLVGWVGLGDVAGEMSGFRLTQAKPTFGFGVRFALDPEQVLNVRADFAYGKDTKGIYFNAKEAF